MSDADRQKWNTHYAAGSYASREHSSALLAEHLAQLPRGCALDLACGAGRNALFLAAAGFDVDAVDISPVALERARQSAEKRDLDVNWIEADLESGRGGPWTQRCYDLIVIVRYVNLELMRSLTTQLNVGGYMLTEQHLTTKRSVIGPANPAFRLKPNELLHAADKLRIISYREAIVQDPDNRLAALAQLIACREPASFDMLDDESAS